MAVIAVISDVHANSFALGAVLDDINARGVEKIYCLGDVVGYNAHPRQTLRMLREAGIPTVKGNHDMMAAGELALNRCGPHASSSQRWTRQRLTEDELHYLRTLPTQRLINDDTLLLHSRLDDPLSYLSSDSDYLAEFEKIRDWQPTVRICFTGHTHMPRIVEVTPDRRLRRLKAATTILSPTSFYFINPGSVGHPRGSDYRASYALLDQTHAQVQLMRVHYEKAAMLAVNHDADIHTDLGPGLLEHQFDRIRKRLEKALR